MPPTRSLLSSEFSTSDSDSSPSPTPRKNKDLYKVLSKTVHQCWIKLNDAPLAPFLAAARWIPQSISSFIDISSAFYSSIKDLHVAQNMQVYHTIMDVKLGISDVHVCYEKAPDRLRELLRQVYKHIFMEPGSIFGTTSSCGAKAPISKKNGLEAATEVTIAYAAHFVLSKQAKWGPCDGNFNNEQFFEAILALFEDPEWAKETLDYFTKEVFKGRDKKKKTVTVSMMSLQVLREMHAACNPPPAGNDGHAASGDHEEGINNCELEHDEGTGPLPREDLLGACHPDVLIVMGRTKRFKKCKHVDDADEDTAHEKTFKDKTQSKKKKEKLMKESAGVRVSLQHSSRRSSLEH
ncbi:uncharacterized protein LAESUDRAFT_760026 [Laetiporus sulphureus 93-53]|uniref:Uncharacterized protein n=1 Tax=Laetiporus sulphureus 93-53 TaxID=1314785 RepID=A0A165DX08_9APHY|nr:uncharacterized protein LAESUDRAFT_760026 [Laetiporus sulphureus 93-53]KZT05801.1 hypothetical protein LAESUDRAFT_760026 [Laetiporus sulphureus 93-53]